MIEYININILVLLVILVIMMTFNRSKKYLLEMFKNLENFLIKELQLFLKNIIDYLAKIELILSRKNPLSNELSLEDLTANLIDEKNSDQLETYLDALQFAVSNKNVINIALTGGFGTGKSTIINEFCKKNRGNEYLHISLANFKDEKSDEKLIETSIVQQILYYEKKLKIKESSYKRIHFTKPLYKLGSIFLLAIWFYSLIFLFFENINSKIIFFNEENTNILSIRFVFILGIICILYKSFDKIKNIKFSKLTPNSLELVNEKTDKDLSVFNRNIDEIIYFFEKTNTNIVIVEDIDRFSDDIAIKLYSKIRELSILIKQSKDVIQQVKFIYSVKDELILEDKTKFFDIIIPVIPIIDYSNSKNLFVRKLDIFFEKEGIENSIESQSKSCLDKNFISEVSNYVYDMRTVINICNEFKLYNRILIVDKPNIDKNKLFAIIFYKNIFPDDFANIQKQNSKLHSVFKKDFNNNEFLKRIISEIEDKIKEKNEEKNNLKEALSKQIIKDINELRNIYVFNAIGMINERHNVKINQIQSLNIGYNLIIDENFKKLKESNNIKFSYDYSNNYNSEISFKEVEKNVNKLTYDEREKLIEVFHNNKIALLEREVIYLSNEKQNIQNLSLCELYQNSSEKINHFIDAIYTSKIYKKGDEKEVIDTKLNPNVSLLKYLFKNDYLNEDFIEYVSYFHLGSLSSNDHKLMMKINQNELTSFDEKIDNVDNLVKSTRDIRFKNSSILIYEIFEFLLKDCQDPNLRNQKLDFVLSQIQNYHDQSVYFIEGFLKKINNDNISLSNFYVEITKWDKFWNLVETKFSEDLKRVVLFDLIQLFSDDIGNRTLIKLNKNKGLTNFINADKDLLKDIFERISIDFFIKTLVLLGVRFDLITPDKKITDLLLKVYEVDLYKVNIDNLKLFSQIDVKYSYIENEFLHSNFSFLKVQKESHLYKRISKNLNEYIENVYLEIEQNRDENTRGVLYLLEQKDEVINLDNKLKIVKKGFIDKLQNFGAIEHEEIQTLLFEENKIFATWINVLEYYGWGGSLNTTLTNYLNIEENYSSLSVKEILENIVDLFDSNDLALEFIYEIINSDEISEECFKSILNSSDGLELDPNEIKIQTRFLFLIDKKTILLNEGNFEYFKEYDEELLVTLIENNEEEFIENIDSYEIEISMLQKLVSSKMAIKNIKELLDNKQEEIIKIQDNLFLTELTEFYINNKINDYSVEIFHHLLISNISEELKITLFNIDFSTQDDNQTIESLKKLGGDYIKILKQEDVDFLNREPFLKFLENLKLKKIIKRTYEKKDNKLKVSYHN